MSLVEIARSVTNDPNAQKVGHAVSAGLLTSSVVNDVWHVIPTIAAVLMWTAGFTWYAIQIYESKTFKDGVKKFFAFVANCASKLWR